MANAYEQALFNDRLKDIEKPLPTTDYKRMMLKTGMVQPQMGNVPEELAAKSSELVYPEHKTTLQKISGGITEALKYAASPAGQKLVGGLISLSKNPHTSEAGYYMGQSAAGQEGQQAAYQQALEKMKDEQEAASKLETQRETAQAGLSQEQIAAEEKQKELDRVVEREKLAAGVKAAGDKAKQELTPAAEAEQKAMGEQAAAEKIQAAKIAAAQPEISETAQRIEHAGAEAEKKAGSFGYKAAKTVENLPLVGKVSQMLFGKQKEPVKDLTEKAKEQLGTLEGIIPEYEYRNMVKTLNADDVDMPDVKAIIKKLQLYGVSK